MTDPLELLARSQGEQPTPFPPELAERFRQAARRAAARRRRGHRRRQGLALVAAAVVLSIVARLTLGGSTGSAARTGFLDPGAAPGEPLAQSPRESRGRNPRWIVVSGSVPPDWKVVPATVPSGWIVDGAEARAEARMGRMDDRELLRWLRAAGSSEGVVRLGDRVFVAGLAEPD